MFIYVMQGLLPCASMATLHERDSIRLSSLSLADPMPINRRSSAIFKGMEQQKNKSQQRYSLNLPNSCKPLPVTARVEIHSLPGLS